MIGHNEPMKLLSHSKPTIFLRAMPYVAWLAIVAAPAVAFDAGPAVASGDRPPVIQLTQNGKWVQLFEWDRRRKKSKQRRRRNFDVMPMRTDPGVRQPRLRQPQRQERNRDQRREQDAAREAVRRGDILPLGGIIRSAQAYCPGKFLGARLLRGRNGYTYRVRILRPNGRRVGLTIDAKSGSVVGGRCG